MPRKKPQNRRRKPSQARSRFTVEQILQGAAQVFEQKGYAAGTTNRIAARAGVSVGTLYQYFPNKDAILTELAMRHMSEAMSKLAGLLGGAPRHADQLDEFLERVFRAMLALHTATPRLHQVLFDETPWPPELRQRMRQATDLMTEQVASLLGAVPDLDLPQPRVTAWLLVEVCEALAHRYVLHHPAGIEEEPYIQQVVLLLGSYLKAGAQAPRAQGRRGGAGPGGGEPAGLRGPQPVSD